MPIQWVSGSNDDSNMGRGKVGSNKPMEPGDYEKVEHELQKQLMRGRVQQQKGLQPWQDINDQLTTHSLDDSEEEDLYFDLVGSHHSASSAHSMESSFSSTTTGKSESTVSSECLIMILSCACTLPLVLIKITYLGYERKKGLGIY